MRKVVPSRQVYHLWANQAQPTAYNASRSVSFDGKWANSYAAKIGRIVRNDKGDVAAMFSNRKWSITTAKHTSFARSAASHLPQFMVSDLGDGWGRNDLAEGEHAHNLADYKRRIEEAEAKAKRARSNKAWRIERVAELLEEASSYCRFFSIASEFTGEVVAVRLAAYEMERAIAQAYQEEEQRRLAAEERIELAELLPQWLSGGDVRSMGRHPDTFLRLSPSNAEEVETSRGAIVPLSHAIRLFDKLERGALQVGDKAGAFAIRSITPEAVEIGCHSITLAEARRFFSTLEVASNA